MPSYQEMLDLLGVKSKSVVYFWINKLIQKGVIEKDENRSPENHQNCLSASHGWLRTGRLPPPPKKS